MSPPMRTWLRHLVIMAVAFPVLFVGGRQLGFGSELPVWALLPALVLAATIDYVGTVGVPGRRRDESPPDEADAVG